MFSIVCGRWYSDLDSDILSDEDIDENESMSVDSNDDDDTRQAAIARLVPGIEPSEYGKMPPSFHDHSQRTAKVSEDPDHATSSNQHDHPVRPPIISRDKYDGVESDEDTDDDDVEDEEEAEDMPQLVGDVEIDMEEEEEEFIEFARQALGMTNEQWHDIVKDREERGGKFTLCFPFDPRLTCNFSICSQSVKQSSRSTCRYRQGTVGRHFSTAATSKNELRFEQF